MTPVGKLTALVFLVLPLAYWHDVSAATNAPKWILLSVMAPFLFAFGKPHGGGTAAMWGLLWLTWASVTMLWGAPWLDGFAELWRWVVLALLFVVGSRLTSREFTWSAWAFALGVAINIPFALAQMGGWNGKLWPLESAIFSAGPGGGLMVNPNYMGAAAALAGLLLLGMGGRKARAAGMLVAAAAPAILSKGATLGLAMAGVAWTWIKGRRMAATILFLVLLIGFSVGILWAVDWDLSHTKLSTRWVLWANSFAAITLVGRGIGSFWSVYPEYHNAVFPSPEGLYGFSLRPQNAHHDLLNLAVETGVIGLCLALLWIKAVISARLECPSDLGAKLCVIGFLVIGLVDFPAHIPSSAAIVFLAAGFLSRGRALYTGGLKWT